VEIFSVGKEVLYIDPTLRDWLRGLQSCGSRRRKAGLRT